MRETPFRSVHAVVASSLDVPEDHEFERLLVAGSVVVRDGEHYRIEGLVETADELDRLAGRRCECGTPLSSRNGARVCRRCHREFRNRPASPRALSASGLRLGATPSLRARVASLLVRTRV